MLKKSYSGTIDVEVPTAFEPAVIATTLSLPLAAEGDYKLEAALVVSGNEIDRTEFSFIVASTAVPHSPRPEIPRYLAERLADLHSLRPEKSGLSFALENRTRPAVLVGVGVVCEPERRRWFCRRATRDEHGRARRGRLRDDPRLPPSAKFQEKGKFPELHLQPYWQLASNAEQQFALATLIAT